MFISYQNFGLLKITFLFYDGDTRETNTEYGYKDALAAIKCVNDMYGVRRATLSCAMTGEVVAEVFPNVKA